MSHFMNIKHVINWYCCVYLFVALQDLRIHGTTLNGERLPAHPDCVVRSFIPRVAIKVREREMEAAGSEGRKYQPPKKLQRAI